MAQGFLSLFETMPTIVENQMHFENTISYPRSSIVLTVMHTIRNR